MQWLPTYLSDVLSANKESLSLTAMPYVINSLVGIGNVSSIYCSTFYFSCKLTQWFFLGAGHFADLLIKQRWTVLSVRRLMTGFGLIGPGIFLLAFCAVDNLLAAVLYVIYNYVTRYIGFLFVIDLHTCLRFVSISMGLCACNSAGHLSNHADVAPNHAGITFAVSNTLVCSCDNCV